MGERVGPEDKLQLDGRAIRQRATQQAPLFMCNRSPGQALLPGPDTVQSLAAGLPRRSGRRYLCISPLPQPDGGLELLTADGELSARLQRQVRRWPVEYQLRVRGELTEEQLTGLREGQLDRGDFLQIQSVAAGGGEAANRWYTVRGVGISGNDMRQLLQRQAVTVSRVLRTALASLALDRSLARGHSRAVCDDELQQLLNPVSLVAPTTPDH